jgi:hypothetical protein
MASRPARPLPRSLPPAHHRRRSIVHGITFVLIPAVVDLPGAAGIAAPHAPLTMVLAGAAAAALLRRSWLL